MTRAYAALVVAFRYPILVGWILAAAAAALYLPALAGSGGIANLIPSGSPALHAEYDATRLFGLPVDAQVQVVQRDPARFPALVQESVARRALAIDQGHRTHITGLAAALPIANTGGVFPGSLERSTTIVTYLYFRPGTAIGAQTAGGQAYARRYLGARQDHLVGVTGAGPAQDAQGALILRYLPWVELATILAIGLIVGLHFRSVGAPLAALGCAAVAYLIATRVAAWAGQRAGFAVPPDLEPVLVVLLLGVTTDYSVFFLAGMRAQLADGLSRGQAARRATAEVAPIIVTAGLVVAAGIGSLAVAQLGPLRAFGPALALTVLIAMLVAVTLAPALNATFGRLLFPAERTADSKTRRLIRRVTVAGGSRRGGRRRVGEPGRPAGPGRLSGRRQHGGPGLHGGPGQHSGPGRPGEPGQMPRRGRRRGQSAGQVSRWREAAARLATAQPVAAAIAAACLIGLVLTAFGLRQARLGFPLIRALPATAEAARAQAAASKGFVPGILSPTEIIVLGTGVTGQQPALARLQHALARQPGVAGVVGPADYPVMQRHLHLMLARSGNAARFAVIERTDPLGPAAIEQVRRLSQRLPALAGAAGLTGVRFEVGGETALAGQAIDATVSDLWRIALVMGLVIVFLLAVFLRAAIAPLYLLAASVLAVLSALGLTVAIFQQLVPYGGLVYYVPFIVAVLLVSLGSDYNVFVVGRIWEEASHRPLRDAVATAVPRASRAITTAALALAAGFATLAIVPLGQFREIAVAMVVGILIDAFVVRSLLVPALVVLFGDLGRWPGRRRAWHEPSRVGTTVR